MPDASYIQRRGAIEAYFDRTAVEAWSRLTSDAPVGHIRATVRAGRDDMRQTLLDWLPADLVGARVLDAGCGTGTLAVEAAGRGADVVAVDLSPKLIGLAAERARGRNGAGKIEFVAGDMLGTSLGRFDYAVAMDSLIHYPAPDAVNAIAGLAPRIGKAMLFTFAPRTPALTVMHAVGRIFPKGDRAPAIEPVSENALLRLLISEPRLADWRAGRTLRIARGFYISQALELRKA